ncbi:hypothetical protein SALWKB2_0786 [Snodgrassella alvi wkB2]|nr:hypothetical protein SALWKB2_0786 [Snodgrassella alvi wkB2]
MFIRCFKQPNLNQVISISFTQTNEIFFIFYLSFNSLEFYL